MGRGLSSRDRPEGASCATWVGVEARIVVRAWPAGRHFWAGTTEQPLRAPIIIPAKGLALTAD